MKYFMFNKALDFQRGFRINLAFDQSGIWVEDAYDRKDTAFFSRILDSKEEETIWHRVVVKGKGLKEASTCMTFYAAESLQREYHQELWDIQSFLMNEDISITEKKDWMKPFQKKAILNCTDALLHDVTGRYAWFLLEVFGQGEEPIKVETIQIYFPKQTWIHYLPEVYQDDAKSSTFLERYLGIFQTLYEDLNRQIQEVPMYFDPKTAEAEFLTWLAEWVDERVSYIWPEDKLRTLIKNSMEFYRIRGTVRSILKLVKLYTGEIPYLVEYHQLEVYKDDKKAMELFEKLYGRDPYSFTLIVKEACVPSNQEYKTLIRILEDVKPAHMSVNVVVIRPYIFLNGYSYLGINSILGKYKPFALDELTVVPFARINKKRDGIG